MPTRETNLLMQALAHVIVAAAKDEYPPVCWSKERGDWWTIDGKQLRDDMVPIVLQEIIGRLCPRDCRSVIQRAWYLADREEEAAAA